jgi:hypothetical protein
MDAGRVPLWLGVAVTTWVILGVAYVASLVKKRPRLGGGNHNLRR